MPSSIRLAALSIPILCASISSPASAAGHEAPSTAQAVLYDASGARVGVATFVSTPDGVLIDADLTGLPPGAHGFHIHETGVCDASDGFKSAGGHFEGEGEAHGFLSEAGPHAGDMPNIHVPPSGDLRVEVFNPRLSMASAETGALFDEDGSALLIHMEADDYTSQPSGDAEARIACGVVAKP